MSTYKPLLLTSLLLLGGCAMDAPDDFSRASSGNSGQSQNDDSGDEIDNDDCKIEGSAIGQVGATVEFGDVSITFTSWTQKDGEPGEYIGFEFVSDPADLSFVVKAGLDLFEATGTSWTHPLGTSGPSVKGISNIDFCGYEPPDDECTDPDGCDPYEPPDDECTDPDGCDPYEPPDDECTDPDGCEPPRDDCYNPYGCEPTEPPPVDCYDPNGCEPTEPPPADCYNPDGCEPTEPPAGDQCPGADGCTGTDGYPYPF